MKIDKHEISKWIKLDGGLITKNPFKETTEELYLLYHNIDKPKCKVCDNMVKFRNFKIGYDSVCSRQCNIKLSEILYNKNTSDYLNYGYISIDSLKTFLLENIVENSSTKLNHHYFITNNYIKELNTLLKYTSLNIESIYNFIYGVGICIKCHKPTKFKTFKTGYRTLCSKECTANRNKSNICNINLEFIKNKFIVNNRFLIKEMMDFFNVSESYVNKYKSNYNINVTNKYTKHQIESEINKCFNNIFKINDRTAIKPKELDLLYKNIAIEYNGLLFHSQGVSKWSKFNTPSLSKYIHLDKTKLCESKNIQLFHIFENEWLNKKEIWKSVINNKLGKSKRIYARKCVIKEVNTQDALKFLDENHLQGAKGSTIKLGLYYNNVLVSLMTFIRYKEYDSLDRLCSKLNYSVIGGASKLLKYFERNYNPKLIKSEANRRWSQGNIYEKLEFKFSHNSEPNYFYFKINENILYSRKKFQKSKLYKLDNYNKELSEKDNMFNNNYRRIYDCGSKIYYKEY